MTEAELLQQDSDNRLHALQPESFIVEAPAGAGKTELLTQRYLGLLAGVNEPEEIVAITFTNKAAAEMRGRILDSLNDAANDVPVDRPHKQVTRQLANQALARSAAGGWDLLAQPGRLRINTIDSLSSLLARQMPLMSRFGAQPAVAENPMLHYQDAAHRTLAMLESSGVESAIGIALGYFDNDTERLAQQLAKMLAKRDQWLHHAAGTASLSVQQEAAAALQHLVLQDLAKAAQCVPSGLQQHLMAAARYAATQLPETHLVRALLDWQTPLAVSLEALPQWRAVCELLLTKDGLPRKEKGINIKNGFAADAEGKAHKQALLQVIETMGDAETFARIRKLPDPADTEQEWRIISALAELLKIAAGQLMLVFQEAGEVDFVEVAMRALQALEDTTGPTELAMQLDYRIQHLLVDEFQDTSPAQIDLLKRLTIGWQPGDGRTLFCVGDPMQSIYRFRKADVGLFLQVADTGIGHLSLQRLQLTRNNRSRPAVVEWINQAFAQVFPEQDSVSRGAISYRRFAATKERESDSGVSVHAIVAEQGTSADDMAALEAKHLVQLILDERRQRPEASIAVLVRARGHLHALVREIRRNHADDPALRFQAVEVEALADRQTVQDALALTKALFHRADRVNWLAILRAPWCGLTLADLHALASNDHQATIWHLMQDAEVVARLSADGQARLSHVRGVIAEAFAHQGRLSARRWVESTWLKLGGAQCLIEAGDVRDVQAVFDLIDQLSAVGHFDPDMLEEAMAELYAAPDVKADGRLQFMTLHKSKGLQFDTVILPGLHRQPNKQDTHLLLWEQVTMPDGESALLAAPWVPRHMRQDTPTVYDYLQGLEAERSSNEAARVLYVGATRAERRLHLVAVARPDTDGVVKAPSGTFLELLWHQVGAAFQSASVVHADTKTADTAGFIPRLMRLPMPAIPALLQQTVAEQPATSFDTVSGESLQVDAFSADMGSLAHRYVEMIARQGMTQWPVTRLASLRPSMQRWLEQRGHGEALAREGAERVLSVLTTTLTSKQGQWVLQQHEAAACELEVLRQEGAVIRRYVVDRTFVEQGTRWIIDYKSARLGETMAETALAQAAELYRPQLAQYAALFAHESRPVRIAVFFLSIGQLVELD